MRFEKIVAIVLLLIYLTKRFITLKKWFDKEVVKHNSIKFINRNMTPPNQPKTCKDDVPVVVGAYYEGNSNEPVKFLFYAFLDITFLIIIIPVLVLR